MHSGIIWTSGCHICLYCGKPLCDLAFQPSRQSSQNARLCLLIHYLYCGFVSIIRLCVSLGSPLNCYWWRSLDPLHEKNKKTFILPCLTHSGPLKAFKAYVLHTKKCTSESWKCLLQTSGWVTMRSLWAHTERAAMFGGAWLPSTTIQGHLLMHVLIGERLYVRTLRARGWVCLSSALLCLIDLPAQKHNSLKGCIKGVRAHFCMFVINVVGHSTPSWQSTSVNIN